jgi:hypothetical protein
MIRVNSWRHPRAALLLRRLSTGNEQAHPRAARDNRRVVGSPLRDAGSAHRNRLTKLTTPSAACQTGGQPTPATDRPRRNPHSV